MYLTPPPSHPPTHPRCPGCIVCSWHSIELHDMCSETINTHTYTHTLTHSHTYTHTHTHTHTLTHSHTHIHTHTHTLTHIHTYTHPHTHSHTHIHTYTLLFTGYANTDFQCLFNEFSSINTTVGCMHAGLKTELSLFQRFRDEMRRCCRELWLTSKPTETTEQIV